MADIAVRIAYEIPDWNIRKYYMQSQLNEKMLALI